MRDSTEAHAIGIASRRTSAKAQKNGLIELENYSSFYRRTWKTAEDAQKAEPAALLAENIVSTKQPTGNRIREKVR